MVSSVDKGGEKGARFVPTLVVAVCVASATLGAVMAAGSLGVAQEASAEGNTPADTIDPDAVRRPATIEESFPSLSAVPSRPVPSVDVLERSAITSSLVSDRQNAQYTSQALRGGEEAAAPPPRSLPPVAGEIRDPNEERRRMAEESGVTAFGSYSRRADGAQVPPPLPVRPEAQSYAGRAPVVDDGRGLASTVPGAVARPEGTATASVAPEAPETIDPAAPRGDSVRPLRVPTAVASLPVPEGQEQRQMAAGPQPRVIASIDPSRAPVPSPASVAAARGVSPSPALVADASVGSRYAPSSASPALLPAPGSAPAPGSVQASGLDTITPGGSIELQLPVEVAPGVIVASVYQSQLAETRRPTSVPVSMPQFEVSSAPALPVTGIAMTPAMQAALGGRAPAPAPVRLDAPADPGRRAAAPARPARATTAAASVRPAASGGTTIGFAAGSIDLSPAARESIRQMAGALQSGAAQVRIVGYARSNGDAGDSVGAFGLSIDRANAVASALMAAGVPPRAVKVEAIVADAGAAAQRSRGIGPEAVVFIE
ncbi:OmpA family protein [Zavarzinia compransoris]|uniref:OmpA family protein n=1 Tax=Zavarzinia marina TaxID=2911065 RepID=UPI001F4791D1|nr:OmpA family protein [Zavarzinia marina]MCF4167703.1 OmpA family protein [Zavarzinia marina]